MKINIIKKKFIYNGICLLLVLLNPHSIENKLLILFFLIFILFKILMIIIIVNINIIKNLIIYKINL